MRLFLAAEAQLPTAPIISDINKKINDLIGQVEVSDYTDALDSVGIIINCFDSMWMSLGHGKERKYISYKNRYADIRLNIPFDDFLQADEKKRFDMVKNIIIESIRVIDERLNKKRNCSFNGEKLIKYIEQKLDDI